MNINHTTQRQFDSTMQREKISVKDYYDTAKTYEVFFRRDNRGTDSKGKLHLFYRHNAEIKCGTVFVMKGKNYLVINQDAHESNIYFSSIAIECTALLDVKYNNKWYKVPFAVDSETFNVDQNDIIGIIDGSIIIYTGLNDIVEWISKDVDGKYSCFGGRYEIKNHLYNDGLAYIYMKRTTNITDTFTLKYSGLTTLNLSDATYQLEFTAAKNDVPDATAIITYSSSDETIGTVDENGLLTMLTKGNIIITATWAAHNLACDATITINEAEPPTENWTMQITGRSELYLNRAITYTIKTTKEGVSEYLPGVQHEIINMSVPIKFDTESFDGMANTLVLKTSNNEDLSEETFTIRAYHTEKNLEATFDVMIVNLI